MSFCDLHIRLFHETSTVGYNNVIDHRLVTIFLIETAAYLCHEFVVKRIGKEVDCATAEAAAHDT